MKHWSLNLYPPHLGAFGRFSLVNLSVDYGSSDVLTDVKGWFSIQLALLGFSATLTYWPQAKGI